MADSNPSALPTARAFPDAVPILIDAEADVTLRAAGRGDLPAIVEQCRDPEMIRWTTVPTPPDGYQLQDAEKFLALTAIGWTSGQRLGWAIEAQRDGGRGYCGGVNLDLEGDGLAEVGFGLHPQARGRSIMTAALQLVCNYGFEVAGLQLIRWRAMVGNWASRRVAAKVGFVFDGAVRGLLVHRGELQDGWLATLVPDDPRVPQLWLRPIEMRSRSVRLRAFRSSDVDRIVEACSDPGTAYWLVSMPRPYERHNAFAYLEAMSELAARGEGVAWCIADPRDDRCLGSISLDGLNGYAKRGEIGYWAHPDARGRRNRGCPSGDPARQELWTGEVAHDSMRAREPGVAARGRKGWLYQNRGPAHIGTSGRRAAGRPRALLLPVAFGRSLRTPAASAERWAACCGKICG